MGGWAVGGAVGKGRNAFPGSQEWERCNSEVRGGDIREKVTAGSR